MVLSRGVSTSTDWLLRGVWIWNFTKRTVSLKIAMTFDSKSRRIFFCLEMGLWGIMCHRRAHRDYSACKRQRMKVTTVKSKQWEIVLVLLNLPAKAVSFLAQGPAIVRGRDVTCHAGDLKVTRIDQQQPPHAKIVFEVDTRPVILYDGVCNMCNSFVDLFLDIDKDAKFRFSPLQGPVGRELLSNCGRSPNDISRSDIETFYEIW